MLTSLNSIKLFFSSSLILRNQIFDISIYFLVVFLLSSTYDTNKLKLMTSIVIISCYLYKYCSSSMITKPLHVHVNVHAFPFLVFFLLIYGMTKSFFYIDSNVLTEIEIEWIYNRNILKIIDLLFAIAMYYYFITKSYQEIIDFIFFVAALNGIVAIAQFIYPELSRSLSGRMTLMSFEPGHAALHYLSVFWLIIYNKSSIKILNFLARLFIIFGLGIRSKIQLFTLLFTASIYNFKRLILSLCLILLIFNFSGLIDTFTLGKNKIKFCQPSSLCDQTYWVSQDMNRFKKFVVDNEKTINLKPSYYIRFFSLYYSYVAVKENVNGIGWGGFNTYYQRNSKDAGINITFFGNASEHKEIRLGTEETTSKSNFMEIIVATGLVGILFFSIYFSYMFKYREKNKGVYLTFISLLVAGMWIETSPFLALLAVTFLLMRKSLNNE